MLASNLFDVQIIHSITEVDSESWDRLSAGRPFTSHRWYRYGESVLADCEPTYIILYRHGQPVARATCWRTANEPLPIEPALLRQGLQFLLKRWPLLICRSPLSNTSGLILPASDSREPARKTIAEITLKLSQHNKDSFTIFDFLSKGETANWPKSFAVSTVSNPGTLMPLRWPSFEAYLAAGNKKDRQHYKRTLREAENLGIRVTYHSCVERIEEALPLIRNLERRHDTAANPWVQGILEHIEMVNGTYLAATIGERLVGCGVILEDNGAQMTAALGLVDDVPYVYLMLVYESLKAAFGHDIHLLRWGSGAYDVKQRLGFSLEDNDSISFAASSPFLQRMGQWLGKLA